MRLCINMIRYITKIFNRIFKKMIDIIPLIYGYSICINEYIRWRACS